LNLDEYIKDVQSKYGDFCEIHLGPKRILIVSNSDVAYPIHTSSVAHSYKFLYRDLSNPRFNVVNMENSGIIANRNLDQWKINREFFIRIAMSKKFLKMLAGKTYETTADMFKLWDIMINDKQDVDLSKWLERLAGDIAISTSTGLSAYSKIDYFNSLGYEYDLNYIPASELEQSSKLISHINSFFKALQYLEHIFYKSLSRPLNDHEIFGVIRDIFLGSIKTVANFLISLSEISEIFGHSISLNSFYEGIEKLLYCDALIQEALRLTTPVPLSPRSNSEPVEVGGYLWKEEQSFLLSCQKININKNDWIDGEIFDPERFLKNINSKRSMNAKEANNKRAFTTFGGGAKICP
ncbi:12498_t:CDS:2, partial [Racocetra fulgida]